MSLVDRRCIPCKSGIPPLEGEALHSLYRQLGAGWKLIEEKRLEKDYAFKNFKEALYFTNQVGQIAEDEGHHPDIHLGWGKVKLLIWTHKIDGLTENDFILAAKCDRVVVR